MNPLQKTVTDLIFLLHDKLKVHILDHGTSHLWDLRDQLSAPETYVFRRPDAVNTICENLRIEIAIQGMGVP